MESSFAWFNICSLNTKPPTKQELVRMYLTLMFARTNQMFKYENLPPSIKKRDLEVLIQTNGVGIGCKVNGKLYVLQGNLGGVANEQQLPTEAIVSNAYLRFDANLKIGKDCVVFKNDSMYEGLMMLNRKYATLLAETDISLKYAACNSRILNLMSADTDNVKKSAEKIIKSIWEGDEPGIITTTSMIDSFHTYPYSGSTNSYIKSLQEMHQYIKANWYIDLGINANYNMKRESLSQNEVAVNEDTLLPFCDDMLECRKIACEEFNKMFGTNISVDFSSSWKKIMEEIKLEIKAKKNEAEGEQNENKGNEKSESVSTDTESK